MSPQAPSLIEQQIEHSSYMRLLAALRSNYLPDEISNASTRDHTIKSNMRYLETIAAWMVTGTKGDVVASAFWRKTAESVTIIAKNDPATLNDTSHAKEFLVKLKGSQNLRDLVPFLVKRRGMENFQKCIKKLEDLARYLNDHDVFITAIRKYCGRKDIDVRNLSLELPKRGQDFLTLWGSDLDLEQALENIIHVLTPGSMLRKDLDNDFKF
ncbi:hypothetical protein C0995_001107 [Termitomyces sp. Mi166|nr:hypothetical protein C0995_001107 [Termitomyces sp. Mi166\